MSAITTNKSSEPLDSPFYLNDTKAYERWRDWKLRHYAPMAESLTVAIRDPEVLTEAEQRLLLDHCHKYNMAIYALAPPFKTDKAVPRAIGHAFGLKRLDPNLLADDDGITSLQAVADKSQRGYIPYSSQRMLWHTDGYYNSQDHQIRSIIMHCVTAAETGGENGLLDHEIAYLLMRDHNPDYIRALMQPDVMTIPANNEVGLEGRPAQTGPVFSVDPVSGVLYMRYTARTRSIQWKQDSQVQSAVAFLETLLNDKASPYIMRHRLTAGQGILCNNVLHCRAAFSDSGQGQKRLLYRARYYDRIRDTGLSRCLN